MDELLTNPNLLKYWNLVKGESKTKLTITDVMSLGQHVTAFDVFPVGQNSIHWTDAMGAAQVQLVGLRGHHSRFLRRHHRVDRRLPFLFLCGRLR